jgi:peroxiredoxin Q/BCP
MAFLLGGQAGANGLEVGDTVPSVTAPDSEGRDVALEDFRGKWVVVYFYPKADTPGCTKQACSLRDGYSALQEAGAVVLGVSVDSVDDQAGFKTKYELPFTLLADKNKEVAKAFGVLARGGWMARRQTFIIDPDGNVAHIIERVNVGEHDDEVLAALKKLQATH